MLLSSQGGESKHFLPETYHYDTIICMNDTITDRQLRILRHLNQITTASRQKLAGVITDVSQITLIRDLNDLQAKGLVVTTGKGPSTTYTLTTAAKQLKLYDPAAYLMEEPDSRQIQFTAFMSEHIKQLEGVWGEKQIKHIKQLTAAYQSKRGSDVASRELERFIIEFSWKSSKIEGNTYSLLDTEQLIKGSIEAGGHSREEALMILNHKTAFDYIWQNNLRYQRLSRISIEEIHQLLTKDLDIAQGLRQSPVGIVGTAYAPPASQVEISSHINQVIKLINNCQKPIIKSLMALVGISYLQPFADGNKRTARLISNALLIAHDYPPLSYRTVDENTFKGALILFYEQGVADYIAEVFLRQFEFAAKNYRL